MYKDVYASFPDPYPPARAVCFVARYSYTALSFENHAGEKDVVARVSKSRSSANAHVDIYRCFSHVFPFPNSCRGGTFCRRLIVSQSSVRSIVSIPALAFAEILRFLVGGSEETTITSSSLSSSSTRSLLSSCLIAI
jgi:hypothetical protein